jgi:tetratricopeptide (TPR) repeat protein
MIFETVYIRGNVQATIRARDEYKKKIEERKKEGTSSTDELAEAYTWLVNISLELGDLSEAIQSAKDGLQLNSSPRYQAVLNNNCGAAYALAGDSKTAKGYLEKSLELAEQTGNSKLIEICRKNFRLFITGLKPTGIEDICLNEQDKINFG